TWPDSLRWYCCWHRGSDCRGNTGKPRRSTWGVFGRWARRCCRWLAGAGDRWAAYWGLSRSDRRRWVWTSRTWSSRRIGRRLPVKSKTRDLLVTAGVFMTGMLVSGLILRFAKNLLGSEDPSERTLVQLVSYGAMTVAL